MTSYKKAISQIKSLTVESGKTLRSLRYCSALISAIILFTWPKQELYKIVLRREISNAFFIVSISIVLLISLVSLQSGKVEAQNTHDFLSGKSESEDAALESDPWLIGTLFFQFVSHTILLSILFFPMLLPGVAISRLSWTDLAKTISIIFSTALLFRVLGFSVYFILRRWNPPYSAITSLFFCFFFLFTAIWFDFANPLVLIYHLNHSQEVIAPMLMGAFSFYHCIVFFLIFLLILFCYLEIHRSVQVEVKPS